MMAASRGGMATFAVLLLDFRIAPALPITFSVDLRGASKKVHHVPRPSPSRLSVPGFFDDIHRSLVR